MAGSQTSLNVGTLTVVGLVALALAGCSSSSSGGLFGVSQSEATAAAAPPPPDPLARPIQVGWTLARAEKCGFVVDRNKIGQGYLAHEGQQGATPERLQQAQQALEYSRASTASKISGQSDYCSEQVLNELRADVPMIVAGNFALPDRTPKAKPEVSIFDSLAVEAKVDEFNRTEIFTPAADKGYD